MSLRVFVGMETSGMTRRAFAWRGCSTISCDILPSDDGSPDHIKGDVFEVLAGLRRKGWWPDLAIFHPTCTFHAISAAWAFNDPDLARYPGVGYHQRVKPETLTGRRRYEARDRAEADVRRLWSLDITSVVIENPIGTLSTRWQRPSQVIQPYWFGDDASKATCLWLRNLPNLEPTNRVPGRLVEWPRGSGKTVERWSNQTDSGQNNLTPGADRWKERSATYPGVSAAFASQWVPYLTNATRRAA